MTSPIPVLLDSTAKSFGRLGSKPSVHDIALSRRFGLQGRQFGGHGRLILNDFGVLDTTRTTAIRLMLAQSVTEELLLDRANSAGACSSRRRSPR
jgi:hypothetical protein